MLGWNKIFTFFKVDESRTAKQNFPSFIEGLNNYVVTARGAYNTIRSRMLHVLSMAYLPENHSVYTITVPNAKHKKLVVARFDKTDNLLSEEFIPQLNAGLTLKAGHDLAEYYITGLVAHQGKLYALSKTFSQVLVIDPIRHEITQVYQFDGIANPQGITFNGDNMQILSFEQGKNVIYTLAQ